ncbi:MAG: hypothetical protein AAGM33_11140 [Pseudomonadota bacterium]
MTMIFEILRAAVLFLALGLFVRQIATYEGAHNWLWWFITLLLCSFISAFFFPVIDHMQPAFLLSTDANALAPISAVIGMAFALSAFVCLQVHIAGGLRNWVEVVIFNLALLSGIAVIEYFL